MVMKKIVLCCTLSVTSSVIAAKMRALVEGRNLDIDVKSMSVGEAVDHVDDADVIMLSPAVDFAKTAFEEAGAKKVVTIAPDEYQPQRAALLLDMGLAALGSC